MSANSVNNGVRNLRAMFENKTGDPSTSPPSRGRSPNPSEFSNSSRPVSKVRASFVAVERPGENGGPAILGLRRASEVSSMGGIQEHAIVDNEHMDKPPVTKETAPKSVTPSVDSTNEEGGLGNILKGSAFVENTPAKPASDAKNLGHALTSGQLQQKTPRSSPAKAKDDSSAARMIEKMQATKENKPEPPPSTTLQTTESAHPVKAPPTKQINARAIPKSPIVTQPSPRTPTSPKMNIRGGPGKIRGVIESAKEAQKDREAAKEQSNKEEKSQPTASKDEKPHTPAPKINTQAKPKHVPVAAKKEPIPTSPKSARSPTTAKPRAPTIPSKLPAAATTTTASAAAKHDAQHSPIETNSKPPAKKPSTLSMRPPRASTSSTSSTLAKKASRASLTNGQQRPQSRAGTSKPDEGFLARMMRPTASSRQKLHEKAQPDSPPKTKSKAILPTKAKPTTKQEPPPKTQIDSSDEVEADNKENEGDLQQDRDQEASPEIAQPPQSDEVKQEPQADEPEKEQATYEPAALAEHKQVNGAAQEVS